MESEKKEATKLFAIYTFSDEEYDVGVDMDINSPHEMATIITALSEMVIKSDTFAEIWNMVNISVSKLNEHLKNSDKVFN